MMEAQQENAAAQARVDIRGEWFREWDVYASHVNRIPRWYWVGMTLSALWLVVYLIIYPSIPFLTGHWQGLGVPSGCRPWTAICEMRVAQVKLDSVRGPYLEKLSSAVLETIATDRELSEFVSHAARVPYAEQCAGCHGRDGVGYSQIKSRAPSLSDAVWLHGGEIRDIKASIQDAAIHPFGLTTRIDELHAKLLAVFVYQKLR
ncbi:MAG: hypothetical protein ABL856_03725 [Gallionella sp.]